MYHPSKRRQRRKPMSEINVVPYIDVMLVLLVIFMVTAFILTEISARPNICQWRMAVAMILFRSQITTPFRQYLNSNFLLEIYSP